MKEIITYVKRNIFSIINYCRCVSKFCAILGGFIASKLIGINSERTATQSKLKEVKYQRLLKTEERDMMRRSMDEEDAICYIHNHMDDIVSGIALEDVYEENELQLIEFETLLPNWKSAQVYIELFEDHLQKENLQFNNDYIPSGLAEEYTDDLFAYEFLKMYAGWGFSDYFENCEPMTRRNWYEDTRKQVLEANTQAAILDIQEQIYTMELERLEQPKGMKLGLLIFALFSVFNIIIPLFLSTIPLSGRWCTIIIYGTIGSLTLGLAATFWYLAQLLRWKENS